VGLWCFWPYNLVERQNNSILLPQSLVLGNLGILKWPNLRQLSSFTSCHWIQCNYKRDNASNIEIPTFSRWEKHKEEAMELFGILSIILAIIGMIVMLKGKRPECP
jgi:hypothetical protein